MRHQRYYRRVPRPHPLGNVPPPPETISRLREFFEISSSKCSSCGEIHSLPADYGITDEASWDRKMDEHLAWAMANKEAVLAALPHLPEWRESCAALRKVLERA